MEKRTVSIVYWAVIVFNISLVILAIIFVQSESRQCLKNPFIYGAEKMGSVDCLCTQKIGPCPPRFSFNDTDFIAKITTCGESDVNEFGVNFTAWAGFINHKDTEQ